MSPLSRLALLAALAAAGCPQVDYDGGTFACETQTDCRDDEACQNGTCVHGGAVDGGTAGSADGGCTGNEQCGAGRSCLDRRCLLPCSSAGDCGGDGDCKLFLSTSSQWSPACAALGEGAEDTPCTSASDCSWDLTCSADWHCREICSSADSSCSYSPRSCALASTGWGLCEP